MVKNRPVTELALEIFKTMGKPIHYKELTKMLVNRSSLKGKTPHESVRSLIGTDKRFKRVAEGVYALAEWEEYLTARFAKNIAYDILFNKGKPLPVIILGQEILNERAFVGTPKLVARNAIRNDARFFFDKDTEEVGLIEWLKA